jgi:L-alanine-DL-glutamate epimerase-like enolase superfamily enzyme
MSYQQGVFMNITDVQVYYIRQTQVKEQCDSGQDALIVKVLTDSGIYGIGEVDSSPLAVKGAIESPFSHTTACGLRDLVIGEDPFETEKIWHKMYRGNIYGGRRGVGIHAMSGIDIALWDIKGKALGLPIWRLLGGGFHKRIRCYASVLFGATPAATGALASRLSDRGFTAVKFGWDPMGRDAETDVALVREARKGLGKSPDLMIDAGLVWDAKTALQRARAFSEHNIFWLEEPLRPDDYEGDRRLSEATEVRIAAGEEESNRGSFLELMDKGKIDIVQVDLTRCGGFTEARKIASLAEDRGLPCVNHGFTTYINIAAALHFLNSIPNSFIMEYVAEEETTLRDHLTRQSFAEKDGYVAVPEAPGLGVELNEEGIQKFRVM